MIKVLDKSCQLLIQKAAHHDRYFPKTEMQDTTFYRQQDIPNFKETPIHNESEIPGFETQGHEAYTDPNDIEAQIKRCKERIAQNISPHAYRLTLAALRK